MMYIHAIMSYVYISIAHYATHLQLVFIMILIDTTSRTTSATLLNY
jgi:hypothetical protein